MQIKVNVKLFRWIISVSDSVRSLTHTHPYRCVTWWFLKGIWCWPHFNKLISLKFKTKIQAYRGERKLKHGNGEKRKEKMKQVHLWHEEAEQKAALPRQQAIKPSFREQPAHVKSLTLSESPHEPKHTHTHTEQKRWERRAHDLSHQGLWLLLK